MYLSRHRSPHQEPPFQSASSLSVMDKEKLVASTDKDYFYHTLSCRLATVTELQLNFTVACSESKYRENNLIAVTPQLKQVTLYITCHVGKYTRYVNQQASLLQQLVSAPKVK